MLWKNKSNTEFKFKKTVFINRTNHVLISERDQKFPRAFVEQACCRIPVINVLKFVMRVLSEVRTKPQEIFAPVICIAAKN